MKRRIMSAVLALCLLLPMLPAAALAADTVSSGKCGTNVTWTLDSAGVLTISGTGPMGNIGDTNPSYTWYNKSLVKSVVIEQGVTGIGYMVFEGCGSLTSVTIPDSVTSIETHAFSNCYSLTGVDIPSSVTRIGSLAFDGCRSLTNVTIPDGVTTIGTEAFRECVKLTSVTIPGSLSDIGEKTFYKCSGLTDVTIQNGVRSIGNEAFWGCSSLTSAVIPDSVTRIGDKAFLSCSKLVNMTIPNSLTNIGEQAFAGCSSLASVTIPSGVTNIGTEAFSGCTGLTSVTILNGLKSIGEEAFRSCSSLAGVTIPDSVTSIEPSAFSGCSSLTSVTIPDSVTSIGNSAFSSTKLTSVVIPSSVTSIGGSVFNECRNLTAVAIPSNVTNIGDYAFYLCTRLTDVYYGGSEEQWGKITIGTYNDPLSKAAKYYSQIPSLFTVTFDSQGGSIVGSQTVVSGKKVAQPNPAPTRTGYTFRGWYKEESCTNPWDFWGGTVTENTTLYAKWTENPTKYTVTFDSQGGSAVSSQTVTSGSKVSKPADPTWSGHTFDGWYQEPGCKNTWDFNTKVTGNITLYAKWTENPTKYTVTFDSQGGSAVSSQTVTSGSKVPKPADPNWSSHTFDGWYKEADCENKWNFDTDTVTGDTTLYAKWTENTPPTPPTYTVTFELGDGGTLGSGTTTLTDNADGKVERPTQDPTRPGYIFINWYTDASCTTVWDFSNHTVDSNTTIYAGWKKDSGTTTATYHRIHTDYYTSGGRVYMNHSSAVAGTRVTIEVSPRSGYELDWLSVFRLNTERELPLTRLSRDEYTFIMPDSPVGVEAAFFREDTGSGGWYAPAAVSVSYSTSKTVKWYYQDGQIRHVTDGPVPYGTLLTRDMLISVLYNMDPSSTGEPLFWATKQKVIPDIYLSGLWGMDQSISREQAAMILYNYSRHMGYSLYPSVNLTGCTDYAQLRSVARTAMSWAQATGLFLNNSQNTLSPKSTLTCEEANVLFSRFASVVARTG